MSPRTAEQVEQIRAESRKKILEAAFKVFAKDGYEAASMAMIAKEAGVSKGLIYNYFDSKEELLKTLVTDVMAEGDRLAKELFDRDPKVTLRNLFKWFFTEMRERLDHWRIMTELTFKIEKFDFVHDLVTIKTNEYVAMIESLLTQMNYKDPLGEARLIAALFDGMGFQAVMMRDDYPLDELEEYLIKKYCK
ncbi:MAG: TetR/AcrR family transcriptional regulator [Bacteroidota bacterium]